MEEFKGNNVAEKEAQEDPLACNSPDQSPASCNIMSSSVMEENDFDEETTEANEEPHEDSSASELSKYIKDQVVAESESRWLNFVEYFRKKYPDCQQCKIGSKRPRHLSLVHYGELAIEAFGKGQVCRICKRRVVGKRGDQKIVVKQHMAVHLEQFIPDNEARQLLQKAKATTETISNHVFKTTLQPIFGGYFKERFPDCLVCKRGQKCMIELKRHLANVHYSDEAIDFLTHNKTCSLCTAFSKKLADENAKLTRKEKKQVKSHSANHFEHFIPDTEAKELMARAKAAAGNIQPTQVPTNEEASGNRSSEGPYWRPCEDFFKKNFEYCAYCQRGKFKDFRCMLLHVFVVHYKTVINESFIAKKENYCKVCYEDGVVLPMKNKNEIVRHYMQNHHQIMIESVDSAEAREVLSAAFVNYRYVFDHRSNVF